MKVDSRAGSKELIEPLSMAGVTVEECILPSGDVEILGSGPGGKPYFVGVEHKTVEDALQSMRNGRAAEQLTAMKGNYNVSWLLIEGRCDERNGRLHVLHGTKWFEVPGHFTQRELDSWMMTVAHKLGVLCWRTEDKAETVRWLKELEHWWTAKGFDEHRAHLAIYTPEVTGNPFERPTRCQRAALAMLPGIGQIKAKRASDHFKTVKAMVNAPAEEWQKIDGIGKTIAAKIVASMDEEG